MAVARQVLARRVVPIALWGALPLLVSGYVMLKPSARSVHFAGDFHYAFWPAAWNVLHGLSPYVSPDSPAVVHAAFEYPAVAALLLAPFALIPHDVADVIFAMLNIAAMLATLRVLGVRDWRLYGLVMLCPAVYAGWTLANVTLLLGLGVAAVWRYRERPIVIGLLSALLISVKLFLWPLALWLLATRRYAALAYATVGGLVLNTIAWAVLGFDQLGRYSRLLNAFTAFEERRGYSLVALAMDEGSGRPAAYALMLTAAAVGAVCCMRLGRRGRELGALALAIAVTLLASPVVHLHYFALLLIPLALVRPRLSLAWALPLAMWVCAPEVPRPWQIAGALLLGAAMVAVAVRQGSIEPRVLRESGKPREHTPSPSLDLRLVPPSASSVATGNVGR